MIKIKEWIKFNLFKILIGLLIISILGNIYLLIGPGIKINNQYIINNHQEQLQYQTQFSIAMGIFMSNAVVEWKYKEIESTIENYTLEKTKLPPEQSFFADRQKEESSGWFSKSKYYLIYPVFKNKI